MFIKLILDDLVNIILGFLCRYVGIIPKRYLCLKNQNGLYLSYALKHLICSEDTP